MNVIRQDVDALNAVLKITVAPEDYQKKVSAILDKHRKTAKIPGFRPGHVPMGMIQKQYGKAVLIEELKPASELMPEMKRIPLSQAKTQKMKHGEYRYVIQRVLFSYPVGCHELMVICFDKNIFEKI